MAEGSLIGSEPKNPEVQVYKAIANLAHQAWTDKVNIRYLFERIERIANDRIEALSK